MSIGRWGERPELCPTGAEGTPSESGVYAARAALAGIVDPDGASCSPAAVLEALAGILADRVADGGESDAAGMVADLEQLAAKWRRSA